MISIAIDGPSGAGKSTMAKHIAGELGFLYIDTGALYRGVALYCTEHGASTTDAAAVQALLPGIELELRHENGSQRVYLCGRDVSDDIRRPEMSMAASNVSAIPAVREFLFDLQRGFAERHNIVMDGRDIGTVVLPHAQIKIFLTATPEERACRRFEDFRQRGEDVDYAPVLCDIKRRDHNDMSREIAPLTMADDAILVDTTGNTLEESAALLLELIRERL